MYIAHCTFYFLFARLDIFDNQPKGIFSLLDDECKLSSSDVPSFTAKVKKYWNDHPKFENSMLVPYGFTIQHFAKKVSYSTVS